VYWNGAPVESGGTRPGLRPSTLFPRSEKEGSLCDNGQRTRVGLVPDAAHTTRLQTVREASSAQSTVLVMLREYLLCEVELAKHRGGSPVITGQRARTRDAGD
jgi:hypothetical protein